MPMHKSVSAGKGVFVQTAEAKVPSGISLDRLAVGMARALKSYRKVTNFLINFFVFSEFFFSEAKLALEIPQLHTQY